MSGATRLFPLRTWEAVATLTSAANAISLSPTLSLLSFPSFVSFRSSDHRKQSFHQNPPRAALPARSRAYSERLHSEPFGRQRPGANRRSIKQFFTRSKQTAASNKNCSLVAQLAASDEFRPPCCSLDGGYLANYPRRKKNTLHFKIV